MSPAGSGAIDPPDEVVSSHGDDVMLTCSADGGPDNVYRWLFSENVLCEECIQDYGEQHKYVQMILNKTKFYRCSFSQWNSRSSCHGARLDY